MYARKVEGKTLTFGVSGKLIMNALVMYDHETDTLWSQLLGEGVKGPLKGTRLQILPATQTTWKEWRQLHPDTLALVKGGRYVQDPYLSYYSGADAGVLGETRRDERLYTKEFVIGLRVEGKAKAYPFRALNQTPVVNDTFGGKELLVVFDAPSGTGVVFERRLGERTLSFNLAPGAGGVPLALLDQETKSTWRGLTGEAQSGPLAGTRLQQVPATYVFWFGWKDFYPETEVYGLKGSSG